MRILILCIAALLAGSRADAQTDSVRGENVTYTSGGITLAAELLLPRSGNAVPAWKTAGFTELAEDALDRTSRVRLQNGTPHPLRVPSAGSPSPDDQRTAGHERAECE